MKKNINKNPEFSKKLLHQRVFNKYTLNERILNKHSSDHNINNHCNFNNANSHYDLKNTHGIGVDLRNPTDPHLIVSSRAEHALKLFSMDGKYRSAVLLPGAYVGQWDANQTYPIKLERI